jgi:signal transduction histidine kinase
VTLTEAVISQAGSPDYQRLVEAFELFNSASAQLQKSYQELQVEARRLSLELAAANAELERSLTEKEKVKNHLKNILESLSNGVVVFDRDQQVTICNPAAQQLLGLAEEACLGRLSLDELPIASSLKESIAQTVEPMENGAGGEAEGSIVILKDITRLKELEARNQRAQRLQAMGEMAVQLAHEIRNPLGSIELFASLLRNDVAIESDQAKWSEQIITGVKFLNTIVSNMLTFTRSSKPQWQFFDAFELIHSTLAFLEPVFEQRNIRVQRPEARGELRVEGDCEMLRQMLMNLFMNALQAMPEQGLLAVRVKTVGEGKLQIEVEDTGIGIAAENVGKIFDPFFTTNEKGTGLGLALVHQIVEKHGGSIAARSEFGKGTCFSIVLPSRQHESEKELRTSDVP